VRVSVRSMLLTQSYWTAIAVNHSDSRHFWDCWMLVTKLLTFLSAFLTASSLGTAYAAKKIFSLYLV
jgi:hypothetical protein